MLTNRQAAALVLAGLMLLLALPAVADEVKPPVAKIEPKIDTVLGTVMVDDYFWLRGKEKPEVIAYLEAENEYTGTMMKHTEELQEKLYQEILGRIKETDLSVPVKDDDYYYYSRDEKGKQYKIYCRKKGSLEADEEIMLDVNVLAEGQEFMSLGTFEVSPNHRLLAYSTDTAGSERYTLRVKNLETGELFPDVIENISGNLEWANDNKTFFYTIPDEAWRPYKLYRHTLGADPEEDQLVYQEEDEGFWLGIAKTKSEDYLLMKVGSKTTDECHFLDANDPSGTFNVIHPRQHELEYAVYHHGSRFFVLTNDNAKNFKLMEAPLADPSKENWKEVIPHRKEVKLDGLDIFKDFLVIYQREDGLRNIRVWNLETDEQHSIEFPEPVYTCYGGQNPDFNSRMLRFTYMSMITPNSVYDYDMQTRTRELKKQREVLGGYDPNEYQSERIFAEASDGARIPISMVYRKGMVKNGENPLYLYGYGAYGASMDPWFSSSRLSLLDRGFIYAVAHVRGGGEMGRYWYDEGKLLSKRNTFTDFIACAEHLIARKYTKTEKLVISGGSAGGLLVGAVVNMRPDLFGAAVASVPFVDLINTMLDESIPLTIIEYEEWGNPNEKEFFDYMMSYSPYDNVKPMAYPDILITSNINDTRVQYWEPAKWIAKLRAVNTGNNLLLMKMKMEGGHGGVSGRYDHLREIAFDYAFILDRFGMLE